MIEVTRRVQAPPEKVWRVLRNGWTYPSWVVGASRMRAVDDKWPQVGSALHHSSGIWPAVLNDETRVVAAEPNRLLVLDAKGRPFGVARVELMIKPDGDECVLTLREDATSGAAKVIPHAVRQALIAPRNAETLRRLAYIAEGRSEPDDGKGPAAGTPQSLGQSKIHKA